MFTCLPEVECSEYFIAIFFKHLWFMGSVSMANFSIELCSAAMTVYLRSLFENVLWTTIGTAK